MRKILFVALAVLAICITVSAVSADDSWSFNFGAESNTDGGSIEINNDELKIQDEEFTIPEGYKEVEKERLLAGESNLVENGKVTTCVLQKGNETAMVEVHFADGGVEDITGPKNAKNVTIAGHSGFLSKTDDGETVFDFELNKKLVEIVAPDQKVIEDILK